MAILHIKIYRTTEFYMMIWLRLDIQLPLAWFGAPPPAPTFYYLIASITAIIPP